MKLSTKRLCILSLLLAVNVAISSIYIPITPDLHVEFTFIIIMYIAANFSLPECITFAVLEDLITYFLFQSSQWPFFPGYTISAVVGIIIYFVFLHKKVSILNVAISKTLVNILINVGLGSLWNAMMYSKAFIYYAGISIIKNLVLLPFEIIAFFLIFKALEPITKKYLH